MSESFFPHVFEQHDTQQIVSRLFFVFIERLVKMQMRLCDLMEAKFKTRIYL